MTPAELTTGPDRRAGGQVTEITTKQDLSRWARAHADSPGIGWSVVPGPGGTMLITELGGDRRRPSAPAAASRRGGRP